MTADEYFQLPEGPPYSQLIDGKLYMSPSPHIWNHQRVLAKLDRTISNYLVINNLGMVFSSPVDVKLGPKQVFQPDIIYVRNENLHRIDAYLTGPPDLAIEVLSPSTARIDLGRKSKVYQQHETPEIWFIDTSKRKITVLRLAGHRYEQMNLELDGVLESALFPGLRIELSELFADPRQESV